MEVIVTRFTEEKAGVFQNGNLRAFDLAPEGMETDLIFHSVKLRERSVTEPEENDVDKTFLILSGSGSVEVEGQHLKICPGDALWLPKGSAHVIKNDTEELEFIVVKKKGEKK